MKKKASPPKDWPSDMPWVAHDLGPEVARYNQALGSALSTWSAVKFAHSLLFGQLVGGGNGKALQSAYWSITSFEGRQKMVNAALQVFLAEHPDKLKLWKALNSRLIYKNKIRNKLAHSQVTIISEQGNNAEVRLVPFMYARMDELI